MHSRHSLVRPFWIRFALLLLVLLLPGELLARGFEVPRLNRAVTDNANMLSAHAEEQLGYALHALQVKAGTQIAVLTVPNLGGLTIEQASIQVVDEWQLGSAERDDGLLILIAKKERRIRIEVGQGLEGVVTDAHAKRIIDESMKPLFRAGNVDGGVIEAVRLIAKRTNPEVNLRPFFEGSFRQAERPTPSTRNNKKTNPFFGIFAFFWMLFFIIRLGGPGGRGTFPRAGGRHYPHGGGGGSFGGGFGGFSGGGGGFSGGGASGGW